MDFTTTEDQQALVGLAAQILSEQATPKRLAELEARGEWYDAPLWTHLADAGIVGAALSEDVGGGGMGFTELALLLEQVGAHVAPVPLLETVLCAALPIDTFGTTEQRQRDLPDVAAGRAPLPPALVEGGRGDPRAPPPPGPPPRAAPADGDGFRLTGIKSCVPFASDARRILVPAATTDGGVVLAL